jgi:hypothetical protein
MKLSTTLSANRYNANPLKHPSEDEKVFPIKNPSLEKMPGYQAKVYEKGKPSLVFIFAADSYLPG